MRRGRASRPVGPRAAASGSGPAARASRRDTRAQGSALLSGQQPLLAERLAVADHGHGAVQARTAHDAAPKQLAVFRALGLRLEVDDVAGFGRRIRSVAVLIAIARRRA